MNALLYIAIGIVICFICLFVLWAYFDLLSSQKLPTERLTDKLVLDNLSDWLDFANLHCCLHSVKCLCSTEDLRRVLDSLIEKKLVESAVGTKITGTTMYYKRIHLHSPYSHISQLDYSKV